MILIAKEIALLIFELLNLLFGINIKEINVKYQT